MSFQALTANDHSFSNVEVAKSVLLGLGIGVYARGLVIVIIYQTAGRTSPHPLEVRFENFMRRDALLRFVYPFALIVAHLAYPVFLACYVAHRFGLFVADAPTICGIRKGSPPGLLSHGKGEAEEEYSFVDVSEGVLGDGGGDVPPVEPGAGDVGQLKSGEMGQQAEGRADSSHCIPPPYRA